MSIKAVDLNFVYGGGTAFEQHALFDVNLEIQDGEFIGLIGHTGSGKSTLIQHLNGLITERPAAIPEPAAPDRSAAIRFRRPNSPIPRCRSSRAPRRCAGPVR